jgi:hypothetical protein
MGDVVVHHDDAAGHHTQGIVESVVHAGGGSFNIGIRSTERGNLLFARWPDEYGHFRVRSVTTNGASMGQPVGKRTVIGDVISAYIWRSNQLHQTNNALISQLATLYTRIQPDAKQDFELTYQLTANELSFTLTPISEEGEFIMRKLFNKECDEIAKE